MAGAFFVERGVFMYPVSEAFLRAVQENTRRYYWTGKITTKGGAVYPFGYEDIVKGSGYISAQCYAVFPGGPICAGWGEGGAFLSSAGGGRWV